MRFRGKRGEKAPGAGPAASLIGIILLIFVFYVILIPPEERARILGENDSLSGTSFPEVRNVLLREQLGRIAYVPDQEVDHVIPNVQLLRTAEAEVLVDGGAFEVSSGAFSEQVKEIRFALDPSVLENVFLSFQAPVREGVLKITLNGFDVFEGQVQSESPPAVNIATSALARDNVLRFEVSGGFFDEKRYALNDVKMIGDVSDTQAQRAQTSFVFEQGEFENLERARLSFFVECLQQEVGTLQLLLNGKQVFSAVPVCDALNQVDLFRDDFVADRNALEFRLSDGGVFLESIRIQSRLGETDPFVGYFSVDEDVFFNVDRGARAILLRIRFVDDGEGKVADVSVNGVLSAIDQEDDEFTLDISSRIVQGNNYVELRPRSDLNIVELVVEYR